MKKNYSLQTKLRLALFFALPFCSFQLLAQSGNALVLNGTTQSAKIANHADLNVTSTQSKSITCWIKTTSITANTRVFGKRASTAGVNQATPGTTGTGLEMFLKGTAAPGSFVAGNAKSATNVSLGTPFTTVGVNDGVWHHLAMVMDNTSATKRVYVYIDGSNVSQTAAGTSTGNDFSNAVDMIIGAAADGSNKFSGSIDDVRIYNGIMTTAQLATDKTTSSVNGATPNLLAAWDFENIAGTNVPDISMHNHPGILTGYTMQYTSTVLSQNNASQVIQGNTNQEIIGINIKTTNPNSLPALNLSQLNFTMNGTTAIADVSNVKLYATGSSNSFSAATQFGTNIAPGAGTLTATGNIQLAAGDNYFWIAYDVAATATPNNLLDATCEGFVIGNSSYTLVAPNNAVAGSRTIGEANALQVSFTVVPQPLQFFARDANNEATVRVAGSVNSPNIAAVKVDFYRNNILRNTVSQNLTYNGSAAAFDLSDKITAELAEYKIAVSAVDINNASQAITVRDSLLAGDAYVVMGQSNSHPTRAGYTFTNQYLRSFGIQTANTNYAPYNPTDTTWGKAQANYTGASGTGDANNPTYFAGPYMVGVWGLQMMEDLKNQFQIPICMINGGAGSSSIDENLPGASHFDLTTVYGRTMYRVQKAGLQSNIKGLFWHQGEKNADGTFAQYPANFDILYNAWKTDLPGLQKVYVFQTNLNGCYGGASVNQAAMREWQRTLPQTKTDISVFPMAGIPGMQAGDGNEIAYCHYGLSGYKTMGSRVAMVVAKDLYGFNDTENVLPPNITAAAFNTGRTQVTLTFSNSNLIAQAPVGTYNLKDYFYFDGVQASVSSMSVSGNTVVLNLTSASTAQTISYLSNSLYNDNSGVFAGPYLTNTKSIGALTFNNYPITGALPKSHLPTPSGNVLKVVNGGGSNQYMAVDDHNDIDIASGQPKTITALIKTAAPAAVRILSKRSGAGYEFITNASGIPGLNASDASGAHGAAFTASPNIADNKWHHMAMVIDQNVAAAKTVKLYIDGVLISTGPAFSTAGDFSTALKLIIGGVSSATTPTGQFNGQLDNVRIWNKAMTVAEITGDMDAVVNTPTTNLLAAWDFENVSGTTVSDVSGNNHPGILVGSPVVGAVQTNMVVNSTSLIQTEVPTGKGDVNQRILAVKVKIEGFINPLTATALNFTMNGTTNIADVTNVKVYYTGTSNLFNTTTVFGAGINPASGVLAASGSQVLSEGDNYFWIAYDVNSNAAEGDLLDATCESIVINGATNTLTTKTVAGARTILLTNTLLYSPGDGGSSNYRIPAIITAADGSLVTAVDKRWNGAGDLAAKIDPVIRRSVDGGKTWSTEVTIANFGAATGAGDCALVMDKSTGNLLCLMSADVGFFAGTPTNPGKILLCRSTDNGVTWSAPLNITNQIYGANCPNPISKNWYSAFVASGRASQLRNGRIIAAIAARPTSSTTASTFNNYLIYSDDGGTTWGVSTNAAEFGGDEAKVLELDNGQLMMSIRNSGTRRFSLSNDKGVNWQTAYNQSCFIDPACDGDFIRYSSVVDGAPKSILLHSIPWAANRSNVSVLVSYDEGKTWSSRKTIYGGASAYSSLAVLPDGTIGIYYENGENATYDMYFSRFSLNWLTTNATAITGCVLPNKAPTASITSPATNAQINSGDAITITADAADEDGTVTKVAFFDGAIKIGESTTAPYTFNYTNVADGAHDLTVKATDNKNEVSTSSATVRVMVSGTLYTSPQSRNISVVYFIPNDVDYPADYHKRLSELMLWGQNWYGTQMQNNGFGNKTFGLLKNAAGDRIKISTVFGALSKASYSYNDAGKIQAEINAYFAAHPDEKTSDHVLVMIPRYGYQADGLTPTGGPFFGLGRWCFALDYEEMNVQNIGKTDALGSRFSVWFGGMMHELGHGLNLGHNRQKASETNDPTKGMALMWAGNGTLGKSPTFLTTADCSILNANQVFNNDNNTYYGSAKLRLTNFNAIYSAAKNAIIVSGKFVSDIPVSDVTYYNDPNVNNEGVGVNRDYNAVTWASHVSNGDSFYVEEPVNELVYTTDYDYELKLRMVHTNGTITEMIFPYKFVNGQVVINYDYNVKKELGKQGWEVSAFSSQETSGEGANNGLATDLIDADLSTFWHSKWTGTAASYPHEVTIDMGRAQEVKGLSLVQRLGFARAVKDFEIRTSTDGLDFTSQGNYVAQQSNLIQYFDFPSLQTFRYFKVIAKSAWDGQQFAALAELGLYHQGNYAPTFIAPAGVTINKNETGTYDASQSITGVPTEVWDDYDVNTSTTFSDVISAGSCHDETIITRTWKVEDSEGLFTTKDQVITAKDNLAPVITARESSTRSTNPGACTYTAAADEFDVTATDNASTTLTQHYMLTGGTTGEADGSLNGVLFKKGITTVTWVVTDACGNAATSNFTVTVNDTEIPLITSDGDKNVNTDLNSSGATVAISATATDNCSAVSPTGVRSDAKTLTDLFPIGTTTITWDAKDTSGNSALPKTQTVIVKDVTPPTIVCPENITLNSCQATATWSVVATDNSQNVTVVQTAGPASGSTFAPGSTTAINYTATDAAGNASNCSFTVTRQAELALTVSNSNSQLYYGYAADQSTIIKGIPAGGVGPYTITITMDRSLIGNAVTSSGDEIWTTSTVTSSSPSGAPIATVTNAAAGSSHSVTATLMANAIFTVTVTDANGCSVSKSTTVYAEDARCFAGNSKIVKVKLCHKTGNSNDPCHEICVPESAVDAHLAHGDFLGACTSNCVAPPAPVNAKLAKSDKAIQESTEFKVIAYPNPADYQFTLVLEGASNEKVAVVVYDMLARRVKYIEKSDGQPIVFGGELPTGEYLAVIRQGANIKTINLIKK